jgi:hypothetical protein
MLPPKSFVLSFCSVCVVPGIHLECGRPFGYQTPPDNPRRDPFGCSIEDGRRRRSVMARAMTRILELVDTKVRAQCSPARRAPRSTFEMLVCGFSAALVELLRICDADRGLTLRGHGVVEQKAPNAESNIAGSPMFLPAKRCAITSLRSVRTFCVGNHVQSTAPLGQSVSIKTRS